MAGTLRQQVLSLYKRIIRAAQTWEATDPTQTRTEQEYIISEARYLFRANRSISDDKSIKEHLTEGESRLEIALHYKTPYPRPVNMPPHTITRAWGKANLKRQQTSRPVYIKSLDTST